MQPEFKKFAAIFFPYSFGVAAVYLFGYWGPFNINILEYGSLTDVAKLSIYPLLSSFVFVGAGFLISELLIAPKLPLGGGNDTPIGRFGFRHISSLLALLIVLIVGIAIYGQDPWRWFTVAVLVSLFSIPLQHNEWIIENLPNSKARATLLHLSLLLLGLAFAYGRQEAHLIKIGKPNNIIDVARSKLILLDDPQHPVAIIGFIGGTYMLYESKTGQVVFAIPSGNTPIYVTPNNKRNLDNIQ